MKLDLPPTVCDAAFEGPVEVHDTTSDRRFYLISAEQYQKIRLLLEVEQVDPSLYEAGDIHLCEE